MAVSTGVMMNRLRKSASPASTWFGGDCCRPRALRVRPSTTRILVKLVQVSTIAGSSESRVIVKMTDTEELGLSVRPLRLTLTSVESPLPFGPRGPAGSVGAAGCWAGVRTDAVVAMVEADVETETAE